MNKKIFLLSLVMGAGLLGSGGLAWAATTGKVFSDFDGDGVQDAGEVGRAGIIVNAYKPGTTTSVATATTDSNGQYSLAVGAADYPVRLEFSFPTDTCGLDPTLDFPAANGGAYGTSVQFAQADGETHNFIFNYPADFSTNDNPYVFLAKMANGDPLGGGTTGSAPALITFHYHDTGTAANSERGGGTGPAYGIAAIQSQVGSVYGTAYSRQAKKVFVSAFMKRHSGMGPLGGGGIYMVDATPVINGTAPDTAANVNFVDLDAIGVATSDEAGSYGQCGGAACSVTAASVAYSPVIGSNTARGLSASQTTPSNDALAYAQVGRVSLGDMDISEDGRYLYVVNLYDRKLYELDLTNPETPVPPTSTQVKGFSIPSNCTALGGSPRPFGLKIARGKAYVGVTCNGNHEDGTVTGGTTADMTGSIYALDLKTSQWDTAPLISFPFNYRDVAGVDKAGGIVPWHQWSSTTYSNSAYEIGEPMISDIEIDNGGNFIVGIMDVRGHRFGYANYGLTGASAGESIATTGDLLRAARDTSVKACKYNIQTNPEFYDDNLIHYESTQGALAVHHTADSDQVLSTFMDPIAGQIYAAGIHLFDNQTGNRLSGNTGYEIFTSNSAAQFGKAGGLGDIETIEVVPSVEIGNRVWLDLNRDGIQDGNEAGIQNVDVTLTCGTSPPATVKTDSKGEFYFSNVAGGNATFMDLGESCTLQVDTQQAVLASRALTVTNADDQTNNALQTDIRDSDAALKSNNKNIAEIAFTVGNAGENNHSLDFGFIPLNADVRLAKVASNTKPRSGETFTYTLTVTNDGPDVAKSISVVDLLPTGIAYVSHTGGAYDHTTGVWDVGDVDVGDSNAKQLIITVKPD